MLLNQLKSSEDRQQNESKLENLNLAELPQMTNGVLKSMALNMENLKNLSISGCSSVNETGLRSLYQLK